MGRYEDWFVGIPWYDGDDPHFNKDGNSLSDWFGDKRHFRPWYDDDSDYNTNAKSYYDYIAYRTRQLDYIIQAINKLLDRNLQVEDTNTVDLEKIGEWLNKDDTETLKAYVKISKQALNATQAVDDGIYTKDLLPDIEKLRADLENVRADLQSKIDNLQGQINGVKSDLANKYQELKDITNSLQQQVNSLREQLKQILTSISTNGKVEVPRNVDISGNNYLINKVDLGNVTDDTRVTITAHMGSTRLTSSYTVGELKGDTCHIFIGNTYDVSANLQYSELFTKIVDGNKLRATVAHTFKIAADTNNVTETAKSYDSDGQPYYDTQSPDYLDTTNEEQHMIWVDKVVVYDLKEPVNIDKPQQ